MNIAIVHIFKNVFDQVSHRKLLENKGTVSENGLVELYNVCRKQVRQ